MQKTNNFHYCNAAEQKRVGNHNRLIQKQYDDTKRKEWKVPNVNVELWLARSGKLCNFSNLDHDIIIEWLLNPLGGESLLLPVVHKHCLCNTTAR